MKKKGFTLVEVVAAVAILAIFLTSISPAFLNSISALDSGEKILNTNSYAQAIIETYRSLGKAKLKDMYIDNGSKKVSKIIYFNDYDDLSESIDNNSFNNSSSGMKFKSTITVDKDSSFTLIQVYKITVSVELINDKNNNKSTLSLYLGR